MIRVAVAAVLMAAAPAAAQVPVDRLLEGLGQPTPPSRVEVDVLGWVERDGEGTTSLVVALTPVGGVKLVADPGIIVVPVVRNGLTWATSEPATRIQPNVDYFATAQQLRLPFAAAIGGGVEADVEYAYCIVREQCLFGRTRVRVIAEAQPLG